MKTPIDFLKDGVLNALETKEKGTILYVVIKATTDVDGNKVTKPIGLWKTGRSGYYAESYDDQTLDEMDYIRENCLEPIYGDKHKWVLKSKLADPSDDAKVLTGFLSGTNKNCSLDILKPWFDKLGYDYSQLESLPIGSSFVREYTDAANTEKGELLLKYNADTLEFITIHKEEDFDIKGRNLLNTVKYVEKVKGALLAGPSGTGKSTLARQVCDFLKAPLLSMECDEGKTTDELIGSFLPNDSGGFDFRPGILVESLMRGMDVLLDEGNFLVPGVQSVLHQFLDDTPYIQIDNPKDGKNPALVEKNPNSFIFITCNPGYGGTYPFNPAMKSRLKPYYIPQLTVEEYTKRCKNYSKNYFHYELRDSFYSKLYEFSNYMQTFANSFAESVCFNFRNAQILIGDILNSPVNKDEFFEYIKYSFADYLSLDNDNQQKKVGLLTSAEYLLKVNELYELYDFKKVECCNDIPLWQDDIAEDTSPTSTASSVSDEFEDAELSTAGIEASLNATITLNAD